MRGKVVQGRYISVREKEEMTFREFESYERVFLPALKVLQRYASKHCTVLSEIHKWMYGINLRRTTISNVRDEKKMCCMQIWNSDCSGTVDIANKLKKMENRSAR